MRRHLLVVASLLAVLTVVSAIAEPTVLPPLSASEMEMLHDAMEDMLTESSTESVHYPAISMHRKPSHVSPPSSSQSDHALLESAKSKSHSRVSKKAQTQECRVKPVKKGKKMSEKCQCRVCNKGKGASGKGMTMSGSKIACKWLDVPMSKCAAIDGRNLIPDAFEVPGVPLPPRFNKRMRPKKAPKLPKLPPPPVPYPRRPRKEGDQKQPDPNPPQPEPKRDEFERNCAWSPVANSCECDKCVRITPAQGEPTEECQRVPTSPDTCERPPNDPVTPPNDPVNPVNPPNDPVNPVNPPNDPVNPPNDPVNPPNDPVNPPNDPVNPPPPPPPPPTVITVYTKGCNWRVPNQECECEECTKTTVNDQVVSEECKMISSALDKCTSPVPPEPDIIEVRDCQRDASNKCICQRCVRKGSAPEVCEPVQEDDAKCPAPPVDPVPPPPPPPPPPPTIKEDYEKGCQLRGRNKCECERCTRTKVGDKVTSDRCRFVPAPLAKCGAHPPPPVVTKEETKDCLWDATLGSCTCEKCRITTQEGKEMSRKCERKRTADHTCSIPIDTDCKRNAKGQCVCQSCPRKGSGGIKGKGRQCKTFIDETKCPKPDNPPVDPTVDDEKCKLEGDKCMCPEPRSCRRSQGAKGAKGGQTSIICKWNLADLLRCGEEAENDDCKRENGVCKCPDQCIMTPFGKICKWSTAPDNRCPSDNDPVDPPPVIDIDHKPSCKVEKDSKGQDICRCPINCRRPPGAKGRVTLLCDWADAPRRQCNLPEPPPPPPQKIEVYVKNCEWKGTDKCQCQKCTKTTVGGKVISDVCKPEDAHISKCPHKDITTWGDCKRSSTSGDCECERCDTTIKGKNCRFEKVADQSRCGPTPPNKVTVETSDCKWDGRAGSCTCAECTITKDAQGKILSKKCIQKRFGDDKCPVPEVVRERDCKRDAKGQCVCQRCVKKGSRPEVCTPFMDESKCPKDPEIVTWEKCAWEDKPQQQQQQQQTQMQQQQQQQQQQGQTMKRQCMCDRCVATNALGKKCTRLPAVDSKCPKPTPVPVPVPEPKCRLKGKVCECPSNCRNTNKGQVCDWKPTVVTRCGVQPFIDVPNCRREPVTGAAKGIKGSKSGANAKTRCMCPANCKTIIKAGTLDQWVTTCTSWVPALDKYCGPNNDDGPKPIPVPPPPCKMDGKVCMCAKDCFANSTKTTFPAKAKGNAKGAKARPPSKTTSDPICTWFASPITKCQKNPDPPVPTPDCTTIDGVCQCPTNCRRNGLDVECDWKPSPDKTKCGQTRQRRCMIRGKGNPKCYCEFNCKPAKVPAKGGIRGGVKGKTAAKPAEECQWFLARAIQCHPNTKQAPLEVLPPLPPCKMTSHGTRCKCPIKEKCKYTYTAGNTKKKEWVCSFANSDKSKCSSTAPPSPTPNKKGPSKVGGRVGPKVGPTVSPKGGPRVAPKGGPRVAPKGGPRVAPKTGPRVNNKVSPKGNTQVNAKGGRR